MKIIEYVKIENFKIFEEEVIINFDNPTVLIGANNAGKTSAIQALALWHLGIQVWTEKKGKSKKDTTQGVGINRLEIAQVPVSDTRFFWNKAKIRQGNENAVSTIKVGVVYKGKVEECTIMFKYFKSELLYAYISTETLSIEGLIEYAATLKMHLLYPMSGISMEETQLQEGAIRKQIGRGQTANVLRNICYYLHTNALQDWDFLCKIMAQLFSIKLSVPIVVASTSDIVLNYNYIDKGKKADKDLDLAQAGRGQQQAILLIAFMLWKKDAILMIDEPDAHFEILRQNQIFSIIKELVKRNKNQVIIVTHSEVILNEAESLVFLMNGKAIELNEPNDRKFVKDALKNYGIEHYYKAQLTKKILYLEGSTDRDILLALSKKLNHQLSTVLEDRIFIYYTQDNSFENEYVENAIDRKSGYYSNRNAHFNALKKCFPDLKGIGVFDGDNKNRQDEIPINGLISLFWKKYEIENYFITPEVIKSFIEQYLMDKYGNNTLLGSSKIDILNQVLQEHLFLVILEGNKKSLEEFNQLPINLKKSQFQLFSSQRKMSELLENIITGFNKQADENLKINKGNFYQFIDFIDKKEIPQEVIEKLDILYKNLV